MDQLQRLDSGNIFSVKITVDYRKIVSVPSEDDSCGLTLISTPSQRTPSYVQHSPKKSKEGSSATSFGDSIITRNLEITACKLNCRQIQKHSSIRWPCQCDHEHLISALNLPDGELTQNLTENFEMLKDVCRSRKLKFWNWRIRNMRLRL